MPYCNQCQLIHGEEHRFCQRCGQLLKGASSSEARPCGRCGTLTWPGQKFCTECGLPLRVARGNQEGEEGPSRPPLFYPRRPETMARRRQRRPGRFLALIALALIVVGGIYPLALICRPGGPVRRFPPRRRPRTTCARKWKKLRKRSAPPISTKISTSGSAATTPPIPTWGGLKTRCWSCGKAMI